MAEKIMQESMQQFLQMASQDQELQEKLKAAPNREAYKRSCVDLGKEKGYSFTSDMVVTAFDTAVSATENGENHELDESSLEAVTGGAGKNESFKIFKDAAEEAGDAVQGTSLNVGETGRAALSDFTEIQGEIDNAFNHDTDVPGDGEPDENNDNKENNVPNLENNNT